MTGVQVTWGVAAGSAGYNIRARLSTGDTYTVLLDAGAGTALPTGERTAWLPLPDGGDWMVTVIGYDVGHTEGAYGQEFLVTLPLGLRLFVQ